MLWLSGEVARAAFCSPAVRFDAWFRGEEEEKRLGVLISIGGVGRPVFCFDMLTMYSEDTGVIQRGVGLGGVEVVETFLWQLCCRYSVKEY